MRMWLVPPEILCRKHLLGCHVEMHMFLGTVLKGVKIDGYIRNNLLEPLMLKTYHDNLVKEMERRGYNHKTEMRSIDFYKFIEKIPDEYLFHKIDIISSLRELNNRCSECIKY